MKTTRKIVKIDEEKCNGCGLCVPSCAEGAIKIIDGKAKLIKDSYCDGLGACLGECPQDAISIEEREADEFDHEAVEQYLKEEVKAVPKNNFVCPGSRSFQIKKESPCQEGKHKSTASELSQWPVQLHLVPVNASCWNCADILIAADCVPFAYADFHHTLLKGKKVIIACPKLDDTSSYVGKLSGIIAENEINSITVAHMEVPCCTGIVRIVQDAVKQSGKNIDIEDITITISGEKI